MTAAPVQLELFPTDPTLAPVDVETLPPRYLLDLGPMRVLDLSQALFHQVFARRKAVRWAAWGSEDGTHPPAQYVYLPDVKNSYTTIGGMRLRDLRRHHRSQRTFPSEAEMNRTYLEATGEAWAPHLCVRCRQPVSGNAHVYGGGLHELPDGRRVLSCSAMESLLHQVMGTLHRVVDDRVARSGFTDDGWVRSPVKDGEAAADVQRAAAWWENAPSGPEAFQHLIEARCTDLGLDPDTYTPAH